MIAIKKHAFTLYGVFLQQIILRKVHLQRILLQFKYINKMSYFARKFAKPQPRDSHSFQKSVYFQQKPKSYSKLSNRILSPKASHNVQIFHDQVPFVSLFNPSFEQQNVIQNKLLKPQITSSTPQYEYASKQNFAHLKNEKYFLADIEIKINALQKAYLKIIQKTLRFSFRRMKETKKTNYIVTNQKIEKTPILNSFQQHKSNPQHSFFNEIAISAISIQQNIQQDESIVLQKASNINKIQLKQFPQNDLLVNSKHSTLKSFDQNAIFNRKESIKSYQNKKIIKQTEILVQPFPRLNKNIIRRDKVHSANIDFQSSCNQKVYQDNLNNDYQNKNYQKCERPYHKKYEHKDLDEATTEPQESAASKIMKEAQIAIGFKQDRKKSKMSVLKSPLSQESIRSDAVKIQGRERKTQKPMINQRQILQEQSLKKQPTIKRLTRERAVQVQQICPLSPNNIGCKMQESKREKQLPSKRFAELREKETHQSGITPLHQQTASNFYQQSNDFIVQNNGIDSKIKKNISLVNSSIKEKSLSHSNINEGKNLYLYSSDRLINLIQQPLFASKNQYLAIESRMLTFCTNGAQNVNACSNDIKQMYKDYGEVNIIPKRTQILKPEIQMTKIAPNKLKIQTTGQNVFNAKNIITQKNNNKKQTMREQYSIKQMITDKIKVETNKLIKQKQKVNHPSIPSIFQNRIYKSLNQSKNKSRSLNHSQVESQKKNDLNPLSKNSLYQYLDCSISLNSSSPSIQMPSLQHFKQNQSFRKTMPLQQIKQTLKEEAITQNIAKKFTKL